jgi:hypothetical protein
MLWSKDVERFHTIHAKTALESLQSSYFDFGFLVIRFSYFSSYREEYQQFITPSHACGETEASVGSIGNDSETQSSFNSRWKA